MDSVTKFKVPEKLDRVLQIVHDLQAQGFVQGQDFDFSYLPRYGSVFDDDQKETSYTEFSVYNPQLATLFALKYNL